MFNRQINEVNSFGSVCQIDSGLFFECFSQKNPAFRIFTSTIAVFTGKEPSEIVAGPLVGFGKILMSYS